MKNLLFIISLLLVVYSCKEDPVSPNELLHQWYYYTQDIINGDNTDFRVMRIDIVNGEKQQIADSAKIFCQPQNGKIIYMKYSDRISPDSGEVRDNFIIMANLDGSNPKQVRNWNTPGKVVFAPGGKIAAFNTDYGFFILNLIDGKFDEKMNNLIDDIHDFSFSKDGSKVALNKSDRQVYIYDINAKSLLMIYESNDKSELLTTGICWNDKNDRLYFSIIVDSTTNLFAYNLNTWEFSVILPAIKVYYPVIFAGGEKLLCQEKSFNPYKNKILICNITEHNYVELKAKNGKEYSVAETEPFINDTEVLAYYVNNKSVELVALNANTGDVRIISDDINN